MIKFENTEVTGWKAAIRGMRNPMNSWEKSDSFFCETGLQPTCSCCEDRHTGRCVNGYIIGENDLKLMKSLFKAGTDHRKFMRMIVVYVDITAPLYWWKEFDTYKVGTVANSCSTMHKIAAKEFTLEDFSCEHLNDNHASCEVNGVDRFYPLSSLDVLKITIDTLNYWRRRYLATKNEKDLTKSKEDWWQMIQLLPSSYNQKRTVMMTYEVLANIYKGRENHKLDEWCRHKEIISDADSTSQVKYSKSYKEYFGFCDWIKTLPYSELITGEIE